MNLTKYETMLVSQIFDNMFSIQERKNILQEIDSSLSLTFILNGNDSQMIYNMFDEAFSLEDKVNAVMQLYEHYGFKFDNIKILLENSGLIFFNHYDSSWRKKDIRRFNRKCYY